MKMEKEEKTIRRNVVTIQRNLKKKGEKNKKRKIGRDSEMNREKFRHAILKDPVN